MSDIVHGEVSTLQPVTDAHDRLVRASNVPSREQSAADQRARVAQRLAAIGQMTGYFVHDLRNILAVIESALSLAEKSSEQHDRIRAYIAEAREAVNRGLKLTSEILTLAKQQELETHPVNANDLLNSLEVLLKYGTEPIIFQLAPDIPMCFWIRHTPFFTTNGENGTGLGLPQVCAFMRQIGGHVGVTNEPGVGTTFDLLCPAVQPDDIAEVHHGAKTMR
jgi:signal transduction histidine kinase